MLEIRHSLCCLCMYLIVSLFFLFLLYCQTIPIYACIVSMNYVLYDQGGFNWICYSVKDRIHALRNLCWRLQV